MDLDELKSLTPGERRALINALVTEADANDRANIPAVPYVIRLKDVCPQFIALDAMIAGGWVISDQVYVGRTADRFGLWSKKIGRIRYYLVRQLEAIGASFSNIPLSDVEINIDSLCDMETAKLLSNDSTMTLYRKSGGRKGDYVTVSWLPDHPRHWVMNTSRTHLERIR